MGFSSHQAYFDPSNWHQQQSHQIIGSTSTNPLLAPPPQPGPQPPQPHGAGLPGSIRPGSMAERARMANVPMPETSLKCPRCESSNTKFCYFNNYSLSQPRHFCKTCRRYWTRGGALRNVPVGGGCRRNKRSKSTSSKSPANRGDGQTTSSSTSSMSTNSGATAANILGLTPPQLAPLRFMSPLSQLTDSFPNDLGFNYSGISGPMVGSSDMNFHHNLLGGGGVANFLSGGGGGLEPWRLQQFPFLGGLESNLNGIYQFQGGESGFLGGGDVRPPKFSASMLNQLASVKMEDNAAAELNLSRQLLGGGLTAGNSNDHQWNNNNSGGGAAPNWTDLSSFSSTSTSNPL